jgi:flagellin
MFRLNTNMNAMTAMNRLRSAGSDAAKRMERLSTGLRINGAGDDAAGLAASEGMRSQLAGQQTAAENIGRAVALLQTADSGLEQIGNLLVRLKELAVQASDGTLTIENRSGISAEAAGLVAEIDRIADATQFNGISLLESASSGTTGARTNLTFFIGDGTAATGQTAALALKGVQFDTAGVGTVGDTAVAITVAAFLGQTSAALVVTAIDTGIDEIAKIRNDVGALQNRMERSLDNLILAAENTTNAISTIRDADFAQEATALTRAQLLVQAGTSMLSQANVMPQTALLLLI